MFLQQKHSGPTWKGVHLSVFRQLWRTLLLPSPNAQVWREQPVQQGGPTWVYKRPSWDLRNHQSLFLFLSCVIKIKPIQVTRLWNVKISQCRNGVKLQYYNVIQETLNCVRKCGLICLTNIHCTPTKRQALGQMLEVAVFWEFAI